METPQTSASILIEILCLFIEQLLWKWKCLREQVKQLYKSITKMWLCWFFFHLLQSMCDYTHTVQNNLSASLRVNSPLSWQPEPGRQIPCSSWEGNHLFQVDWCILLNSIALNSVFISWTKMSQLICRACGSHTGVVTFSFTTIKAHIWRFYTIAIPSYCCFLSNIEIKQMCCVKIVTGCMSLIDIWCAG